MSELLHTFVGSYGALTTAWLDRAACRHEDPELFFPAGTSGTAGSQVAAAKQVCARCPVRTPCLRFALSNGETDGIWGGLTEDERRALLRAERKRRALAGAR
ncbi:MAG: WhiB family transcriptional regulator [Actinobacteria bacterium]|nr:WhiB family transcriptional regulator [Actinomycetota bacterium]